MFHQIEGLVIDRDINMGHLKTTLETFIARFFELDAVQARFRPHHFPFTEPSAEMDIQCDRSGGKLVFNTGDDWLEILGCGMVHPNVLINCGLDPNEYQGFAFGMGLDRLAMLKYGVPDLRPMFEADTRWLAHYGFSAFAAPNPASGLSWNEFQDDRSNPNADVADEKFGRELVARTTFEKEAVWLPSLAVHHMNAGKTFIEDKTFTECLIEGPAVMAIMNGTTFDGCNMGVAGNPATLLLQPLGDMIGGRGGHVQLPLRALPLRPSRLTGSPELLQQIEENLLSAQAAQA